MTSPGLSPKQNTTPQTSRDCHCPPPPFIQPLSYSLYEMTTGHPPPTIPSVETGTPLEWSESILASGVAKDTPVTSSGGADNPNMTEEKSRKEPQVAKDESKPTTTMDQPSIGETVVQTAKQYVPDQVGKAVDYATQTAAAAASYLPDPQGIKNTMSSYLSMLSSCERRVRAD